MNVDVVGSGHEQLKSDRSTATDGESGNCKTYCFEGVALLTAFATRNLVRLTLVVADVQSRSGTLRGFEVTPIVA